MDKGIAGSIARKPAQILGLSTGSFAPKTRGPRGRRCWLAEGKAPDDRIVAITDERIRQILTAAAKAAGLKKLSPHWAAPRARVARAPARAPAATIRDSLGHASLSTTDLYLSSSPTDGSSLYLKF